MKYISLLIIFLFISCAKKQDVLLPKANVSIVKNVEDHSPIYIFFKTEEKDTIAEVNRKNSIISTNWIFNIDKRLPLKLIIPEVIKLQEKKRSDRAHKNEKAHNYYSYADSVGKNLAFLPFTNVYYKMNKPEFGILIFFTKTNSIFVNGVSVDKVDLQNYLTNLDSDKPNKLMFSFEKDMSFENYIQNKIWVGRLKLPDYNLTNEEFIF
ncbi:hypothetical protein DMB65_07900 [Flavobacterium cheongpyeongense]|uniref:Lipoprotein n=1 Tax=Flavobacterium cheongpyeongense TaxID=2212651 RepID=A0A2V4BQL5_9FLAO|nr:hypothetical protein [Flavobacterium cheongpyeongense]PXY41318.1 hypothetical protein DMB65_07900 [Flavobacterium cheongpyeongense]